MYLLIMSYYSNVLLILGAYYYVHNFELKLLIVIDQLFILVIKS